MLWVCVIAVASYEKYALLHAAECYSYWSTKQQQLTLMQKDWST